MLNNTTDIDQHSPDVQQVFSPAQQSTSPPSQLEQSVNTHPSLSQDSAHCIVPSSLPAKDPSSLFTPSVPLSSASSSSLYGYPVNDSNQSVVRYVPINSTPTGTEFILVPSSGVQVSTQEQTKSPLCSTYIDSVPPTYTRYIPVNATNPTLVIQSNPSASHESFLNIHTMQTRSKSKSHHDLTTTIFDLSLPPIIEPTNIYDAMNHSCWQLQ